MTGLLDKSYLVLLRSFCCVLIPDYTALIKMKIYLLIALFSHIVANGYCYEEKFDKLDLRSFFADDAKVKSFFGCMSGEKPCSEWVSMKGMLKEVFTTDCTKCSESQKKLFNEGNKIFLEKYPEEYKKMLLQFTNEANN